MKREAYQTLLDDLPILFSDKTPFITLLANLSAELKQRLTYCSWVGFYLIENGALILGPFQGKPACETIALGKGVCGTAASTKQTIIVKDVHTFSGHIACDGNSRSEIVIPLIIDGHVWGVLDLDSYQFGAFDEVDKTYLEQVASFINRIVTLPKHSN